MFLSDEGPTLETLDFTIRIGSTATFLYFDLKHERCVQNMKDACKIRDACKTRGDSRVFCCFLKPQATQTYAFCGTTDITIVNVLDMP